MNATVVLDKGGTNSFTNLDEVSGRVVVRCAKSTDVNSIVVKLEGESRTRLMSPGTPESRPRPQLEYHKILYKLQMVFPPADVVEGRNHVASKQAYTLAPGEHEYLFKFKIPFNNSCANDRSQMPTMSMSGTGLEIAKPPPRHVKKTLPPTLSGFPGEAEIRYFVKATVARHSFFKENPRAYTPFNFLPIEPPRAPPSGSEIFARQKHSFSTFADDGPAKAKMKGIFGMKKDTTADAKAMTGNAPFISVDARLPEPAVLTCNQEVPLRLIVKKLNGYHDTLHLQSLQVALIGNTNVRAQEVFRTETSSFVIMSQSNMNMPIGSLSDPVDTETIIDERLWRGQRLPNIIAPSFETCNISRTYQLDVRVGLSYGGSGHKVRKGQIPRTPQTVILPLRLDTLVYSGISPPPKLLEAMAKARAGTSADPRSEKLKMETRRASQSGFGANQVPPTPMDSPGPSSAAPDFAAQPGASPDAQQPPLYTDAPPSYEDAIATELQPVDAPRPEYAPPPHAEDALLGRADEKKG